MNIEELINGLKEQGLETEQILQSLEQMVNEGKLTPEEYEQAKQLLVGQGGEENGELEVDEKEEAEKLFGLKFI